MKLEEIKEIQKKHKKELQENFKIKNIGIFGSYVRGEQREASDVDILVEFEETPSLFDLAELKYHLSELLGVEVDVVMRSSLRSKPGIGERILKEVVMV